MKRIIAFLLSIIMVVSVCPVTAFAAATEPNVTLSVDKTEVNVGDTVTVKLGITEMTAFSLAFGFDFDNSLLEVSSITARRSAKLDYYGYDPDADEWFEDEMTATTISTKAEANNSGHVGAVWASDTEYLYYEKEAVVTIKFVALAAGTVEFEMFEDSSGTDGYKGDWTHETTVEIKEAAPSCTHENTKAVSNGNGTHNIVCADEACGTVVTENVTCSGGTATCTAKAKCSACGAEYGNLGEHNYGDLIPAEEAVHTQDELKAGVAAHYYCSVCNKYFTEEKVETTLEALTGETPAHTEDTKTETTDPTCTEEGKVETVTFCTECGAELGRETIETIPAAHTWGAVSYNWSADYSDCEAVRVCTVETCKHEEKAQAEVTSEVKTPATCTEKGWTSYTANFEAEWADTQTEDVQNIELADHSFTDEKGTLISEGTCMAEAVYAVKCDNCDAESETLTVKGEKDPDNHTGVNHTENAKDATCTEEGYTGDTVCECGETVAYGEAIEKAEHSFNEEKGTLISEGTCMAEAVYAVKCDNCDAESETLTVKGEKDPDNHTGKVVYTNNGDTHSAAYDCCDAAYVTNEVHTYDETTHACVCGAVEEFTLTVNVLATGDVVELTVPYGANLLEVLAQAADEDKLPAIGDKFRVNDEHYNGEKVVSGYSYFASEDEGWPTIEEDFTMPGNDFAIDQDHYEYGWHFADAGTEYHCEENGWLNEGWHYIEEDYDGVDGGAWYYFAPGTGDWEGRYFRAEGVTRAPYPTEAINGNTYAPDAETLDYCANKGIAFIDATEAWFVFDEDGKFQSDYTGSVWLDGEEGISWAVDGMLPWHYGMVELNDDEYVYFIGHETKGGNVMAIGDVYVQRNNTDRDFVIGGIYTFDAFGALCEYDGITDMGDGTLRYYEDAQLMAGAGLTKVGENYIYVRSNGELVVNAEYYIPANSLGVVPGTYEFDENGFLVAPEMTGKNGVYFENGAWYYYVDGTRAYGAGLIEVSDVNWINGEEVQTLSGTIYVKSNGQLATGAYYVTNVNGHETIQANDKVIFGDNGLMIEAKNGIINEAGVLYYYINNVKQYNSGVIELNGSYYYVRSNGIVVANTTYWITNVGDSGVVAKLYSFDENGVMLDPEFAAEQKDGIVDGCYYENGSVAYGKGLVKLSDENGEFYIYVRSNGQLATGSYWPTNTNGFDVKGALDFGTDGKCYI